LLSLVGFASLFLGSGFGFLIFFISSLGFGELTSSILLRNSEFLKVFFGSVTFSLFGHFLTNTFCLFSF